ncbi:site-specific DNA-methyltransferase [Oceanobacillus sp. AG]|uniref:site-specific DNA-methyltransferase n=1 Tax=Oceanobacillus sp. AG TaxID=2681969 RepID=UPI0012EC6329|nr:site-specific DNA-methyltransferase [Oceanobacillus sp. AG]
MNNNRIPSSSPDLTQENIEKLKELFPEVVTEGRIDFDMLKTVLGKEVDDRNERYRFEWHGKREALLGAQQPSKGTLRPDKETSKNFDTTENLYIEGDNLEVLKLLQKSYNGKVKMIFIDPPYNTGNDFVYEDDFKDNIQNYLEQTGQVDENGNKLKTNTETNGRKHTNWLNMMYPRLKLARNLLKYDGVIFISIDDHEVYNLKKLCDEIFGEVNFLANIVWQHSIQPKGYLGKFSVHHNHILVYSKSPELKLGALERTEEHNKAYSNPDNDPNGPWRLGDVRNALYRPNLIYNIISPSGKVIEPPEKGWRWSRETIEEKIRTGEISFNKDETGIIRKIYLKNLEGRAPETIWFGKDVGTTREGNKVIKDLFDNTLPFDTPKPVELIKRAIHLSDDREGIILDFFAGSSTTAHAVMDLNAQDKGTRKFIMVQLPEQTDKNSVAYNTGYKDISAIGQERIRRAGEQIIEEHPGAAEHLDIGFKVLKLDKSNIREWNVDFDKLEEQMRYYDNMFVPDRSELDVVYEIMLKYGLELTYPVNTFQVDGKNIYDIAFGNLFICLDDNIDMTIAQAIIDKRNDYGIETSSVVFADYGFRGNDSEKLNCFKLLEDAGYQDEQLMTI